jgi:predicted site-specific integrase-resolvase
MKIDLENIMTPREAWELLRCSRAQLYVYIESGLLPTLANRRGLTLLDAREVAKFQQQKRGRPAKST